MAWDYLYVLDGPSTSSPQLAALCGNRSDTLGYRDILVATSSAMTIVFRSDSLVNTIGFQAVFTVLAFCDVRVHAGVLCERPAAAGASVFSPRMQHGLAYDPVLDVMYVSFGRNWSSTFGDLWKFDFGTTGDVGLVLHPQRATNAWTRLDADVSMLVYATAESSVVVVPLDTSFRIYVYSGFTDSSTYTRGLSVFDSATATWSELTPGPIGISGGTGVYHAATHTIHFFVSYPLSYVTDLFLGRQYVLAYAIDSDTWSQWAAQPVSKNRYLPRAAAVSGDYGVLFGGMEKGWDETRLADDCFSGEIQVLDLACGTWSYYAQPASTAFRRMGFGMAVRGSSLLLVGGNTGILLNDMVILDLDRLPPAPGSPAQECAMAVGSLRLPTGCTASVNRDVCRGVFVFWIRVSTMPKCVARNYCAWCDSSCGFNNASLGLPGLGGLSSDQTASLGLCSSTDGLTSPRQCPILVQLTTGQTVYNTISFGGVQDYTFYIANPNYDVKIELTSVTNPGAELRITAISMRPYTPTSTTGRLKLLASDPTRVLGTAVIRISWGHDRGVISSTPLQPATNHTDGSTQYALTVSLSAPGTEAGSAGFQTGDIISLVAVFCSSVFVSLCMSYLIRKYRTRVLASRIATLEMAAIARLPPDPPKLFRVTADVVPRAAIAEAAGAAVVPGAGRILRSATMGERHWPIAVECLPQWPPVLVTPMAAITYLAVHPGSGRFLRRGDLPVMSFATRIVVVTAARPSTRVSASDYAAKPVEEVKTPSKPAARGVRSTVNAVLRAGRGAQPGTSTQ
ncbi:hypothetical protein HK105_203523 [Polyrhizophydium stewartii]|uniref:CUB domain-containing protein n=1 Tax=Polyrhizophydium stewartii TaxID=2732419 RepID=A0ABR4NBC5_9FUNG